MLLDPRYEILLLNVQTTGGTPNIGIVYDYTDRNAPPVAPAHRNNHSTLVTDQEIALDKTTTLYTSRTVDNIIFSNQSAHVSVITLYIRRDTVSRSLIYSVSLKPGSVAQYRNNLGWEVSPNDVTNDITNVTNVTYTGLGNGLLPTNLFPAFTGPVGTTASGTVTFINPNVVTNSNLSQVSTATFKGRFSAGTGNVEDMSASQATSLLNAFSTSAKGLVPAPGSSSGNFLRDDGVWATFTGGTVSSFGFTPANGIFGSVTNPTSTPNLTLGLGNITPASVAATGTLSGSNFSGTSSGTNTGDQTITLTGDVTGSGTGSFVATIASNTVTNAKAAQMGAGTIKGNNTGGTANASDLTAAQVTAMLNQYTSSLQGLVPGSGGGTTNFLRADGTWAAPSAGSVSTVSATGINGVNTSVTNPSSTPLITVGLGNITPASVTATGTLSGSNFSGTHSGTSSGTNTGDQTITLTGGVTGSGTGSFAATVVTNANLTGPVTSSGNATSIASSINLPGSPTTTTQAPLDNSTKIATTGYVDSAVTEAQLTQNHKAAVKYATVAALPTVTYSNGTSGFGATLTATANGAISVDGVTPTAGDRILVKNQASQFQNGPYLVTTVGNGSTPFLLTRDTDSDQSAEWISGWDVLVLAGNTLGSTAWAYTGASSPTMGTTALTFVQVGGVGIYTSGNGISITGSSIAIDTSVTVDKNTAQALTNKNMSSGTNTWPTFNQNTTGSAATLTTPRTIGGVSFDGSANITVASATGGFTISGGDLALGANNITMSGSIGTTGTRVLKGWFTDLQVTNAIAGSITGNAATVTTNANLTGPITSSGNTTAIASQTGTGSKFVVDTSPTIVTPTIAKIANLTTNGFMRTSGGDGTLSSSALLLSDITSGPNKQIIYGITTGVTGNANFTYDASVDQLQIGSTTTSNVRPGLIINDGAISVLGRFDESTSDLRLSIGIGPGGDTARILFGHSSGNWQIDNNGGIFRWFTPGVEQMKMYPAAAGNAVDLLTSKTLQGVGSFTYNGGITQSGTTPNTFTATTTFSAANIATDTTTGMKIGTSTSQKIAFYNSTPIVKPSGSVITGLTNLGLITTPTINFTELTGTLGTTQMVALTGDVTNTSGTVATTIANSAVTNAKMANMAAGTFKGNNTGGSAAPSDLTATQVTAALNQFTSSLQGLVPGSGGGTSNFLRADGTWTTPAGGGSVSTVAATGINGVNTSVVNPTSTPLITIGLGNITPASVAATGTLSGSNFSGTSSGTNTGDQTITLTGDVTGSGTGSFTATVVNIPTSTTMAGSILATAITAPSTPAAGKGSIYIDSTSKNISVKDDAGVVKHGVQTNTGSTNNFVTAISDAGVVSIAQPSFSNLSGTLGTSQMVALTGDVTNTTGTVATTIANSAVTYAKMQNASTTGILIGRKTAGSGVLEEITPAGDITLSGSTFTIANNAVSNAKIRQSSGLSVVGNSTNATANVADITGTAGQVLRVSGTTLGFGAIDVSSTSAVTNQLNAASFPVLTGDVTTAGGALATTIATNAVTNTKLAQIATATFKGRTTAGTGNVEDLTVTQATAMLNQFTSSLQGLVPGSGGGTSNFLRADGSWAAPPGGGGATWNNSTSSPVSATAGNNYVANLGTLLTFNLPTPSLGATIEITGLGAGGWIVQCASTHTIRMGSIVSAATGTAASTNQYDTVRIVGVSTTQWHIVSAVGTIDIV